MEVTKLIWYICPHSNHPPPAQNLRLPPTTNTPRENSPILYFPSTAEHSYKTSVGNER